MSSSLLSAALDDATSVVKKQKTTSTVTAQAIDAALRVLEEAQEKCGDGATTSTTTSDNDANAILAAAAEALKGADASSIVAAATKDLHGAVGKLGKVRRKREMGRERERKCEQRRHWGENDERRRATGTETLSSSKTEASLSSHRKRCSARACALQGTPPDLSPVSSLIFSPKQIKKTKNSRSKGPL